MDLFDAIETRSSAARLAAPGPSPEQLQRLLRAAERAPDHGRLKPWRLIVLDDESRAKFAQAAAEAKRARLPDLNAQQVAEEYEKIKRSPVIIVIGCVINRSVIKIPEIEQIIAAGAAAQNLFLAAHALGFGVMWKTGAAAYDSAVKATLGLDAQDHIVAIMHLGTRLK